MGVMLDESKHADLLNELDRMASLPMYTLRRTELRQAESLIVEQEKKIAALEAECAPFRPMSIEEAEAALDAIDEADCPPMSPEQIEHGVKYATDAEYRAEWLKEKFNEQCRINRGLRAGIAPLVAALEGILADDYHAAVEQIWDGPGGTTECGNAHQLIHERNQAARAALAKAKGEVVS